MGVGVEDTAGGGGAGYRAGTTNGNGSGAAASLFNTVATGEGETPSDFMAAYSKPLFSSPSSSGSFASGRPAPDCKKYINREKDLQRDAKQRRNNVRGHSSPHRRRGKHVPIRFAAGSAHSSLQIYD